MPESRWTDERIDDFAKQVWISIDDLPNRMTRREISAINTDRTLERLESSIGSLQTDITQIHDDFLNSKKGLSRPEKIALFAATTAFVGLIVTAIALIAGLGA